MRNTTHKIKSRKELLKIVKALKKSGKKIVFTNGCFDILHPGHIKIFEKSARLGDILIVGLNTDSSVRRLKGASRPIMDEKSRARVVAALQSVDYVTLFDEDTPLELIKAIKPHILVKGGDYRLSEIVGAPYVEKVIRIPLVKNFSTTSIIKRILKNRNVSSEK